MALTRIRSLYAINDSHGQWNGGAAADCPVECYLPNWQAARPPGSGLPAGGLARARRELRVAGGFMDRLPLACLAHGLVDYAEKWHYVHQREPGLCGLAEQDHPLFGWRGFYLHDAATPFASNDMRAFLQAHGAPHILCIWGLGVDERILLDCRESFKVYYSIDADPLRVPLDVAQHFDLILAGDEKQRATVLERFPSAPCALLTLGPEFADHETFRPLDIPKTHDLVYVACAQPYKRHDILFQAMAELRDFRPVSCLCVCGYGELVPELERTAREMQIQVDFVGPPSVPFAEVNALINRARIGIVAGADEGCPGVITEYMLAGLPVLMNAGICCGLRFVTPETGWTAKPRDFALAIQMALDEAPHKNPRRHALARWGWQASVRRFGSILEEHGYKWTPA